MARVSRLRQAEQDLLAIAEFIARDSPEAATRWLDEIDATLAMLASYPKIGERVNHIRPGLRQFCQGSYVLFYEPRDDGIGLVRVLHGSRRIEDLFE